MPKTLRRLGALSAVNLGDVYEDLKFQVGRCEKNLLAHKSQGFLRIGCERWILMPITQPIL